MEKITKNTIWLFGSQVFAKAIGFFYVLYLARTLGVKKFGQYEAVLAFIFIFFTLVDFGIPSWSLDSCLFFGLNFCPHFRLPFFDYLSDYHFFLNFFLPRTLVLF